MVVGILNTFAALARATRCSSASGVDRLDAERHLRLVIDEDDLRSAV